MQPGDVLAIIRARADTRVAAERIRLAEVPQRDSTWKLLINEVVEVDARSPRPTSKLKVEINIREHEALLG